MLRLSKKVEYGLMALLHMDAVRRGGLTTAKEIAETYSIPAELLGKVLQTLARSGIVQSEQGVRGGYRLARELEAVTLGEVVAELDGPVRITRCCDGSTDCLQHDTCNIRSPVQRIQEEVVEHMAGLSLARFRVRGGGDPAALEVAR
jgi:Rrf2 family protein